MYETEILSMEKRIGVLADEARAIRSEHWHWHLRENAPLKPRSKARLNVWVRERKGGLEISWTYFRFVKTEGSTKSKPYSTHITKGRSNQYRRKSLEVRGKPWEMDMVMETEERMSQIRAEYTKVRNALRGLKEARKLALARGVSSRVKTKATNIEREEVEA